MKFTRRQFIGATVSTGIAGAGYGFGYEPTHWEVTHTTVTMRAQRSLKRPVRVLHLSDLHASIYVSFEMIREALDLGLAMNPDLIFVTGDFFTGIFDQWEPYKSVLRLLSEAAPTYAVLGNHDGQVDSQGVGGWATRGQVTDLLEGSGLLLLYNESRRVTVRGQSITLLGLGDLWRKECVPSQAFASHAPRGIDDESWRILLSHNPDAKELSAAFDWDLMLSGHTHGGQVVVPLVGPLWVPVEDKRFIAGLYDWGERQLFVTRGVGNLRGIRFNCRPEISLLELI